MSRVSGIAEQVRVMILGGELGLGEPVVDERLRVQLRVRRGTLREALRRLEGEGLLVSSDSGAMRVLEIDDEMLREMLQTRAALEALAPVSPRAGSAMATGRRAHVTRSRRWPPPRTRPAGPAPRWTARSRTATSTARSTRSAPTVPPRTRWRRSGTG